MRSLLPHLPCFSSVSKHLSFTKASQELAISQSAVSYQIQQLENKLGFSVLKRQKGGQVELTERGRLLLQEYRSMENSLSKVVESLSPHSERTNIRLTVPVDLGTKILVTKLKSLESAGLIVDLHLSDTTVRLKESNFDMAIRSDQNEDGVCHESLLHSPNVLVCGVDYRAKNGVPSNKVALDEAHLLLRNRKASRSWSSLLQGTPHTLSSLKHVRELNNSFALLEAAKNNMGIAILPRYMVEESIAQNQLCEVELGDAAIADTEFFVAYETSSVTRRWASLIRDAIA
ncbi:LysR family transcriptional regulator [Corallincola platygyrae]|uniref:LysR family transcriptional regulator n=1 Tax=Corallincola platygyrae TaxID=1193278 RepID=A0ABW4XNN3_9GAMM